MNRFTHQSRFFPPTTLISFHLISQVITQQHLHEYTPSINSFRDKYFSFSLNIQHSFCDLIQYVVICVFGRNIFKHFDTFFYDAVFEF